MSSLKEARQQLLLSNFDGDIDDEEFLLLFDINKSDNLDLPYKNYESFDLDFLEDDFLEDDECVSEFRFHKRDIPLLAEVLQIPESITCYQRSVCDGVEALCIVLKRLAYPCRYSDLMPRFARAVPVLCLINNHLVDFIYETHRHRLLQWNQQLLNANALEEYTAAISAKGSPLDHCFGFIDGTVRPICRPSQHQEMVYNGHKRVHSLKFQSVALPNGMIGNMFGPVEGKRHDAYMLRESGLLHDLELYAFSPPPVARPLCLYGDPAYPLRIHLQGPFRNTVRPLTVQMEQFNQCMSYLRSSVEWIFGDIVNYFKFIDFKKNQKIGLSTVGKTYIVSALLRNALTCLYGNTTSQFFGLEPPTLQDYFA